MQRNGLWSPLFVLTASSRERDGQWQGPGSRRRCATALMTKKRTYDQSCASPRKYCMCSLSPLRSVWTRGFWKIPSFISIRAADAVVQPKHLIGFPEIDIISEPIMFSWSERRPTQCRMYSSSFTLYPQCLQPPIAHHEPINE